jgi:hypothetical protein
MKTAVQTMHKELIECASIDLETIQLLTPFLLRAIEREKNQTIYFANKCRLINDVDFDGNVSFVFTPELQFDQMYDKTKNNKI